MWHDRPGGCDTRCSGDPRFPVLALISGYRIGAALNIVACALTFGAAAALPFVGHPRSDLIIIDDFNIFLIILTTFVGFTTSIFSASYLAHEIETGRLTPSFLRFYHAMYQALMGAMSAALPVTKRSSCGSASSGDAVDRDDGRHLSYPPGDRGGMEIFLFSTGSVGIGLAFFGTILVYLVAQEVFGRRPAGECRGTCW